MLKIYVVNLGKYNEGELVGKWVSLPASAEELEQLYIDIKVAHRNETGEYIPYYEEGGVIYEETAIHDYESEINGVEVGEYESIDKLNALAETLTELDEDEIVIIETIIEAGYKLQYALEHKDDVMFYADMTIEDVAAEVVEEGLFFGQEVPESMINYIDYEAVARDLAIDSYYEVESGVIYIP